MIALTRGLHWQGAAGIIAAIALAALLLIQKGETRHFRKERDRFERLYREGEARLATVIADQRAATVRARSDDRANAARVAAAQDTINRSSINEFQIRLSNARARAERLRQEPAGEARGGSGGAAVPRLPSSPARTAEGTGENRLPAEDAMIATEQAIQLDALIQWVRAQSTIDPNEGRTSPTD